MEQRRNTVVIRQQVVEARPWARTTLNIALAIALGVVAVIAIVSIGFLLRRFREKNKVQGHSTSSSQRLRESQLSGTVPVILPNNGRMGSIDTFGTSSWRTGLSAFLEKPVLPREDTGNLNLSSPPGLNLTPRVVNKVSAPQVEPSVVPSRPIPDGPTTALYSSSRENHAVTTNNVQPPKLTRRSVSTRLPVPQDISDSEGSNQSVAFARFSGLSDYMHQSPKPGAGPETAATSAPGKYAASRISNPFSQPGTAANEEYYEPAFTAGSVVRPYGEDGDGPTKPTAHGNKRPESTATIATRSSAVLTANTLYGMPSAPRNSGYVPSLPPILPQGDTSAPLIPTLNRLSTGSRILHSRSRPSLESDGVSAVRKERPDSQLSMTVKAATPEKPSHMTSNSTSSVVNIYPQDMKRRGQLRTTPRRKERPVSLMVPAIPRRMDVIITASPGPGA